MSIRRVIQIPRPSSSGYTRPITAHLFFAPDASELAESTELILDIPGGGFVSMTPEHHEDRLCAWAARTGRPVLSLDYGKAPECECGLLYLFYVRATAHTLDLLSDFVAGMWEPCGKLCNPCGADVLLQPPERSLIDRLTLMKPVTSQILTHTRWMKPLTPIRFSWTPPAP
jgi:hypothetical protein